MFYCSFVSEGKENMIIFQEVFKLAEKTYGNNLKKLYFNNLRPSNAFKYQLVLFKL